MKTRRSGWSTTRDLQLPRAAGRLEAAGHTFAQLRQRGHRACLRSLGPRLRGPLQRHVGLCPRRPARDGRCAAGKLVLNRDHFGIKPLYYARSPRSGRLLFAGEIKGCCKTPSSPPKPDEQDDLRVLAARVHDHRVETFFRGVYHVPAANLGRGPARADRGGGDGKASTGPSPAHREHPLLDTATDRRRKSRSGRVSRSLSLERRAPPRLWRFRGSCLSGGLGLHHHRELHERAAQREAPDASSLAASSRPSARCSTAIPSTNASTLRSRCRARAPNYLHQPHLAESLRSCATSSGIKKAIVNTGPYAQWCVMRSAPQQVTVLLDGQGGR